MPNISERFLRVTEVASRLGIKTRTVWRRVAANELPLPCHIGRCAVWPESEIESVMQQIKERRPK